MMGYIVWNIAPEVFSGLGFLRWYGLCWATGMLLAYQLMVMIYKREGHLASELDTLTIYVVLGVVIGARLGHVLFYDLDYYLRHPVEVLPFRIEPAFEFTGLAGLASHGGVLGALLGLYLFSRKHKADWLWALDRLTIAASLLGFFIRLGNLMNSEIIGIPADVPWAFVFLQIDQLPRHPAQLYEALFYLVIAITLFTLWRSGKFRHHRGFLFGLGLSLIFAQRFVVEFVKENQVDFEDHLLLNMGQLLSIPLVVAGVAIMMWSLKRPGGAVAQAGSVGSNRDGLL